jgi:hypothetical protein
MAASLAGGQPARKFGKFVETSVLVGQYHLEVFDERFRQNDCNAHGDHERLGSAHVASGCLHKCCEMSSIVATTKKLLTMSVLACRSGG